MKRVLFDENVPRKFRLDLPDFDIRTTQDEGWSSLKNGELLRAAQDRFEVLVTVDKRLQFQQNISTFRIAVVVVAAASTRLAHPSEERLLFRELVGRYHYLGHKVPFGAHLRYLVYVSNG